MGSFPVGLWISILLFGLTAGINLICQTISIFNWRLALRLKVQEHAPDDSSEVNRTHMVMEWGHAVADFVVYIVVVPLGIILTIRGHYWGFVLITFWYIFLVYVGVLGTAQRYGLVKYGLKESFKEYRGVLLPLWLLFVFPGLIGAVSLWVNASYFKL
jgi:hypothetical protein